MQPTYVVDLSPWTQERDDKLLELMQAKDQTEQYPIITNQFNAFFGTQKISKQIRERYVDHLDPDVNRGDLTSDEKSKIIRLKEIKGLGWVKIGLKLKRTALKVRNWYHSNVRKQTARKRTGTIEKTVKKIASKNLLNPENTKQQYQTQIPIQNVPIPSIGPQSPLFPTNDDLDMGWDTFLEESSTISARVTNRSKWTEESPTSQFEIEDLLNSNLDLYPRVNRDALTTQEEEIITQKREDGIGYDVIAKELGKTHLLVKNWCETHRTKKSTFKPKEAWTDETYNYSVDNVKWTSQVIQCLPRIHSLNHLSIKERYEQLAKEINHQFLTHFTGNQVKKQYMLRLKFYDWTAEIDNKLLECIQEHGKERSGFDKTALVLQQTFNILVNVQSLKNRYKQIT